jgi:hypothetical protein
MPFTLLLALLFPGLALALSWQDAAEIANGRGERGPWQQNESRYDYVDDPTVALDEEGHAAVAWVDQGRKDVLYNGVNVSRSPSTFSWLPRLALAPGRVYVLWQEILFTGGSHGGDILFARSGDGGQSFSRPLNLSAGSRAGDGKGRITKDLWHNGSLDIAADADGNVYVAWTEYEGALWFARSGDGGASFSPLTRINEAQGRPARAPALALGPGGTVHLAWTDGDIHVARSFDNGKTFKQLQVTKNRPYSDAPKLAVDPAGTVHLVYAERERILYTSGDFSSAREISAGSAGFPSLAVDGRGTLYALWEQFPGRQERPRGLAFAVSRDGGRSFSPPARVPQSLDPSGAPNGSFQGLLMRKLAVNRRGDVAVVNSSLKDGERSRVWLMRGSE